MHEPRFVEILPRTTRLGKTIVHLHTATSTQDAARERAAAGAREGTVIVADEQTGGQGRRGRAWTTVGTSLAATVILRPARPAAQLALLPLAAGLAAAEAAERLLRIDVRIKWPNDLTFEDRKLGGILVDAKLEGETTSVAFVGIGINGDVRADQFPAELAATATSLSQAAGRHVCLPALLKILLERLEHHYDALLKGQTGPIVAGVKARLATLGRRVRVQTEKGPLEGVAVDLDAVGGLIVETEEKRRHHVASGECQELRPA